MNRLLIPGFLLLLIVCVACGPQQVRGKAPFVSIASMTITGENLSASFNIRNINDVPMDIDSVDITVRIRDVELTRHSSTFALSIDPNTTEDVVVEKLPDEFARDLLANLETGDVRNLPFFLEGRLHTAEDGYMPFRHEGYLYPVPGRPGHFRSTSSQTREQR